MAKYGGSQLESKVSLRFIANELAEGNRLKRLELDNYTPKYEFIDGKKICTPVEDEA